MRFNTNEVDVDMSAMNPSRSSSGEYTDPPPCPNIEKIKAIRKAKMIAAIRVELIAIIVDSLCHSFIGSGSIHAKDSLRHMRDTHNAYVNIASVSLVQFHPARLYRQINEVFS